MSENKSKISFPKRDDRTNMSLFSVPENPTDEQWEAVGKALKDPKSRLIKSSTN